MTVQMRLRPVGKVAVLLLVLGSSDRDDVAGEEEVCSQIQATASVLSVARRRAPGSIDISVALNSLMSPPSSSEPLQLADPNAETFSQFRQDLKLWPLLQGIEAGFFVESGAFDGEKNSNSLLLERDRGWKGLLVEPLPENIAELKRKHRHAHVFAGALSNDGVAKIATFNPESKEASLDPVNGAEYGHLGSDPAKPDSSEALNVVCIPLVALLEHLGRSTVDFWSLDIEGSEGPVLAAFDFDKIEVGTLLIEANKSDENNRQIAEVMEQNGFKKIGTTELDWIYVNPAYFAKRGLQIPEHI
eukprot:gnl/TRDRNA2_/TRDRNA2_179357_c0_seq1.p1 gnl/TRDRNA2_/TRDRNA2_179357_c0~~gnl/TRDRNA2_/TRDRNA2_179357_c0_seq1.p1  ORF type:complete len:302 (+),score=55.40 gnl/TRDRNA2_/TRDRNA2_179357_c0_seq1:94-999(+)